MSRYHNRRFWPALWLTIAQAFVVHAVVPGMTLRPAPISDWSTAAIQDATDLEPGSQGPSIRGALGSNEPSPSDAGGRRRSDRCRAFFAAFKATPTKGHIDCLIGVAEQAGLVTWTMLVETASKEILPDFRPSPSFNSLAIELCRLRC